jgi:hypothetical protein
MLVRLLILFLICPSAARSNPRTTVSEIFVPALSAYPLEQKLAAAKSTDEMKAANAAAYRTVRNMVRVEGENKLWQRVAQRSYDVSAVAR